LKANTKEIILNCKCATYDVYSGYVGRLGLFCYYHEYPQMQTITKELRILESVSGPTANKGSRVITVNMTPYLAADDYAQIIHCAEKFGLLFVMTKKGILYVYEMTSGVLVYWHKVIAQDSLKIVHWCRNCATDGIVILINNGDLIHIDVKEDRILDFIFST